MVNGAGTGTVQEPQRVLPSGVGLGVAKWEWARPIGGHGHPGQRLAT